MARAEDKSIGGHVGFGFPLVTDACGHVHYTGDCFQMSLPVGITVSGSGRLYFDLEFVPLVVDKPDMSTSRSILDYSGNSVTALLPEAGLDSM